MVEHVNILIAVPDSQAAEAIARPLRESGHACTSIPAPAEAIEEAGSGRYDVVITNLGPAG